VCVWKVDSLVPDAGNDMTVSADDYEICLGVDCQKLAQVATEADIILLLRCGVFYDGYKKCLKKLPRG
jgi:hypothetical protein